MDDRTAKWEKARMDPQAKFMWMKELLGRLERSNEQLQWPTTAGSARQYLARAIERDLGEFRRLCHSVRHEALTTGFVS